MYTLQDIIRRTRDEEFPKRVDYSDVLDDSEWRAATSKTGRMAAAVEGRAVLWGDPLQPCPAHVQ